MSVLNKVGYINIAVLHTHDNTRFKPVVIFVFVCLYSLQYQSWVAVQMNLIENASFKFKSKHFISSPRS